MVKTVEEMLNGTEAERKGMRESLRIMKQLQADGKGIDFEALSNSIHGLVSEAGESVAAMI